MTNNVSKSSPYIRLKYQIYAIMNYTDENKMLEVKRLNLYSSAIFYRFIFCSKINYYNPSSNVHIKTIVPILNTTNQYIYSINMQTN